MSNEKNSASDFYAVLGVDKDASPTVLKRAYLQLIQVHTPERDAAGFQQITDAYQVLSNPEKRKAYDSEERLPQQLQDRIAEILEEAGEDHGEIADSLTDLVEEWPALRRLREMAGHYLLMAKRPGEAAYVFSELCDLEPENPRYLTRLGAALLECGDTEDGVATLKAAIVADPNNTGAYIRLAHHHLGEEQPREAVRILERGISADGKLDAADLPLLIQLVIVHGRELEWQPLHEVGERIRSSVPASDKDGRRYVASQLSELIAPYANADRPDMLHFLFEQIAHLDPDNLEAAKHRDELKGAGSAWREQIAFFKAQSPKDWFGAFVYALQVEDDDDKRTRFLTSLIGHIAQNKAEAEARWYGFQRTYPHLAKQLRERWDKLLELATNRGGVRGMRESLRAPGGPHQPRSGCLVILTSAILLAGSVLLAFTL
ncbi:MAG: DnaJ domain-containing protein [Planctomycetota bacterium]